jgi:hypothetical protein
LRRLGYPAPLDSGSSGLVPCLWKSARGAHRGWPGDREPLLSPDASFAGGANAILMADQGKNIRGVFVRRGILLKMRESVAR